MKSKTHYPSYPLTFEDAFYYHDTDLLRDLLRQGLSPNSHLANGEWLFIEALKRLDFFYLILHDQGANTNVCSLEGDSAFLVALPTRIPEELEEWWPQADVNTPRHDGARPLHIAVDVGYADLIRWLRGKGADLSLCNAQGETPLAYCRRKIAETTDREKRADLLDAEHALTAPVCAWNEDALRTLLPELRAEGLAGDSADEVYTAALQQGNVSAVRRLLAAGADPNAHHRDSIDTPPLFMAYKSDAPLDTKHELLRLLVEHGAEPSAGDEDNDSVLHEAAGEADAATVELMLELGANPYRTDAYQEATVLAWAILDGRDRKLIFRLLELGIDVNEGSDSAVELPLYRAVQSNDLTLVQALLDKGAHPFHVSQDRLENIVSYAEGHLRTVSDKPAKSAKARAILSLLKERYPFIENAPADDSRNRLETALWQAAVFGLAWNVHLCLYHGASPNACNLAGISALHMACERGHEKIVYTLLRYGANPNVSPAPLEAALRGKGKRTERIVRLLLGFGANPNSGEQPMLLLARTPQLIHLLLAAGARVDATADTPAFTSTSLHRHARRGKTACVQALLEARADTEARNIHGMTPLHLAIARGKTECVRALLAAGADINARDYHGNTPLMTAFSHRRLPLFRELLQAGADTAARDCGGRSIADDIRLSARPDAERYQQLLENES